MDMADAVVSSDSPRPLGVFGGAFDPVLIGHLRGAIAVREELQLERATRRIRGRAATAVDRGLRHPHHSVAVVSLAGTP